MAYFTDSLSFKHVRPSEEQSFSVALSWADSPHLSQDGELIQTHAASSFDPSPLLAGHIT